MSNDTPIDNPNSTPENNQPKVSAKAKPAKAEKPQRSGPHPLSWINLVLMLGLFAVAGYAGFLGWQQQQKTSGEVAVLRDRPAQAQAKADALGQREQDLLQQAQSLTKSANSLQEQVAHNTDRLGKLPGAERQDW